MTNKLHAIGWCVVLAYILAIAGFALGACVAWLLR